MFFCFFFGCEACEILAPWTGIEPGPLALEREVLTTEPPGESLWGGIWWYIRLKEDLKVIAEAIKSPQLYHSLKYNQTFRDSFRSGNLSI